VIFNYICFADLFNLLILVLIQWSMEMRLEREDFRDSGFMKSVCINRLGDIFYVSHGGRIYIDSTPKGKPNYKEIA
jgi:hypothetical protein